MTTLTQETQEAALRISSNVVKLNISVKRIGQVSAREGIYWERDREKWIKVEDQLPKTYGEYLVVEDENYGVMWFDVKKTRWGIKQKNELPFFFNEPFNVTHWQPLPQPPKA